MKHQFEIPLIILHTTEVQFISSVKQNLHFEELKTHITETHLGTGKNSDHLFSLIVAVKQTLKLLVNLVRKYLTSKLACPFDRIVIQLDDLRKRLLNIYLHFFLKAGCLCGDSVCSWNLVQNCGKTL